MPLRLGQTCQLPTKGKSSIFADFIRRKEPCMRIVFIEVDMSLSSEQGNGWSNGFSIHFATDEGPTNPS